MLDCQECKEWEAVVMPVVAVCCEVTQVWICDNIVPDSAGHVPGEFSHVRGNQKKGPVGYARIDMHTTKLRDVNQDQ